jgi:alpha-mannosidase II
VTTGWQDPSKSFVWAEVSYLSMWWDLQSSETRENFRRLVHSGQLEVVTGGWVMPDEATTHYFALLDQLIEGHQVRKHVSSFFFPPYEKSFHIPTQPNPTQTNKKSQWLEANVGVRPQSGWACDPFGHSPTMAYVFSSSFFYRLTFFECRYLLKRSGFEGMVIQRTHYEVKRMMAERTALEFLWQQDWGAGVI